MLSAKQQPSNIKHGGGIRPNVWILTFGPPPLYIVAKIATLQLYLQAKMSISKRSLFGQFSVFKSLNCLMNYQNMLYNFVKLS